VTTDLLVPVRWVDLTQGKVPVDEAQLVTPLLLHSLDDTIGMTISSSISVLLTMSISTSTPPLSVWRSRPSIVTRWTDRPQGKDK
jgi:hypothetical protein